VATPSPTTLSKKIVWVAILDGLLMVLVSITTTATVVAVHAHDLSMLLWPLNPAFLAKNEILVGCVATIASLCATRMKQKTPERTVRSDIRIKLIGTALALVASATGNLLLATPDNRLTALGLFAGAVVFGSALQPLAYRWLAFARPKK